MKPFKITQSITNKDDISIKNYFRDISKIPLLTKEEELELGYIIQNNLKKLNNSENLSLQEKRLTEIEINKAVNKLVSANLKFVISVAKQYCNQGLPFIDLVNEGNLGMIQAAKKFDPNKGYKFISYAVWWIRQSIMQALSDKSRTIRLPLSQVALYNKVRKATSEFIAKNEREPSLTELEELTGIPEDKILAVINSSSKMISVDSPLKEEEQGTFVDIIPNQNIPKTDHESMNDSKNKEIQEILKDLNPRSHDIIRMYFGFGCTSLTLEQIADRFGVHSERIRQLKEESLNIIKDKVKKYLK